MTTVMSAAEDTCKSGHANFNGKQTDTTGGLRSRRNLRIKTKVKAGSAAKNNWGVLGETGDGDNHGLRIKTIYLKNH